MLLEGCLMSRNLQQTTPPKKMLRVSGYVLDAKSRQPLSGVPVAKNGAQTLTNKDGFFRLTYPATPEVPALAGARDGLGIYSLDYAGSAAIPADTAQRATVLLQRTGYRTPPDTPHPLGSVYGWPCASPWRELPGTQRAFLMQNSADQQPHKLRALTLRVGKGGFIRGEWLRVRIYRYNGPDERPGEDLLTENVILCLGTEGVLTYSLYDVTVPGTGFFVALESPVGSDAFYCHDPVVGYTPTGPVLRPPYAFDDTRTWCGLNNYNTSQSWQRLPPAENCWPLYESAISAEIDAAPSPATTR